MTQFVDGVEQGGGVSTFEDLTDAETMVGTANKYWRTNAGETALEAATPAGGGDVTAAANITITRIVIGSDGAKGVEECGITVDASENMAGMGTVDGRDVATDGGVLDGIEPGAQVCDATNVAAAGAVMDADFNAQTILAATADDTPAALTVTEQTLVGRITSGNIAALSATQIRTLINVVDGANAYIHPNHSGEVTSSADGAQTITNKAVTLAKMNDMATASLLGRNTAGVGVPEVLSKATVLSLINVADGANAYVHPNHSGDVTSVADGAQTIAAASVTLAKMANMATASLLGRSTAATGVPEVLSKATALTLLNVADGADVTGSNAPQTHAMSTHSDEDTYNISTSGSATVSDVIVGDAGNVGSASAPTAMAIAANGDITLIEDVVMATGKLIGTATNPDLMTIADASVTIDGAIAPTTISATALGGDLSLGSSEILIDTTPGSDNTASGLKGVFTNGNGGNVDFGDVCYVAADSDLEFVDADAIATGMGLFMALAEIAPTASGEWLMWGIARHDDWTWTPGGIIYCTVTATTGNTLSQTAPVGAVDVVVPVGVATHADRVYFNPGMAWAEITA